MAYVCVEVCCSPNGDERYPVPTTLRMVAIYANRKEALEKCEDQAIKAQSEFAGQDIYYLLWKTDEPLNIDRNITQDNTISNVGSWLPDSERLYGVVSDLKVELVPPERIKQRAAQREKATATQEVKKKVRSRPAPDEPFVTTDMPEYRPPRMSTGAGGTALGRTAGAPWRQVY